MHATTQVLKSTGAPVPNFATTNRARKSAAAPAAKPHDLTALRNALPFFKKGRGKVLTSWWNVTPSGDYVTDLETGKAYARAFLPMMTFNAGPSTLGVIVADMATAGRDPAKNSSKYRGVDAVALGFLHEIGNTIQAAIGSIALAAVAIKHPKSELGPNFVKAVDGGMLQMLQIESRSTLFHDPGATIFSEPEVSAEIYAGSQK